MTQTVHHPKNAAIPKSWDFDLGIPGFRYADLYEPERLKDLLEAFDKALQMADPALFAELRQLRKLIATEQNVPPFIIFGDRSLHEMATHFPQTKTTFANIFGVGKTKLEQYSDRFLACICAYATEHERTETISHSFFKTG